MTQPPPAASNGLATAALVVGTWLLAISTAMERDSAGANATVHPLVAGIA